jgi:hypothetical protein
MTWFLDTSMQRRTFFMHMKIFKVGVVTGLTEGTVAFVDEDRLMVKADNQTGIFS